VHFTWVAVLFNDSDDDGRNRNLVHHVSASCMYAYMHDLYVCMYDVYIYACMHVCTEVCTYTLHKMRAFVPSMHAQEVIYAKIQVWRLHIHMYIYTYILCTACVEALYDECCG